jgi:hypothetical protein
MNETAPYPHPPGHFEILARDPGSAARRGRLWTAHGPVETPVFMPVGTQGSVKAMSPAELQEDGLPHSAGQHLSPERPAGHGGDEKPWAACTGSWAGTRPS